MNDGPAPDIDTLRGLLIDLYAAQDEALRTRYRRSLPFQDGLFDRWARAERLGFGKDACVYNSALVMGEVTVGEGAWVGPYTFLDGGYAPVTIGAWVSVSAGVMVYSHDTVLWSLSGGRADKRTGPVTIGDRCYVGSQAVIGPGVTVGRQSVIATKSYVNRDVPPRSIVGGVPARRIGRVDGDDDAPRLVFDDEAAP